MNEEKSGHKVPQVTTETSRDPNTGELRPTGTFPIKDDKKEKQKKEDKK